MFLIKWVLNFLGGCGKNEMRVIEFPCVDCIINKKLSNKTPDRWTKQSESV